MYQREELHNIFVTLLGSSNVYFQPPTSIQMRYPCILYELNQMDTIHSNDISYINRLSYTVIVIDSNPDTDIPNRLIKLPMTRFERHYTAHNLNHYVFNIYF